MGYGANAGHDDFNVTSLNALIWLVTILQAGVLICWVALTSTILMTPVIWYLGHDDKSEQMMFGLGLGTQLDGAMEVRADIRGMADLDDMMLRIMVFRFP